MERHKRIALIDDDPIINLIHAKIITRSTDFEVMIYTNAQRAVEQFAVWLNSEPGQLPDVIFLDINMPEMDGWEFLDAFHKMPEAVLEKCKVFMLTSSISSDDIEKSRHYRTVSDFISKPLTPEKLSAMTNRLNSN